MSAPIRDSIIIVPGHNEPGISLRIREALGISDVLMRSFGGKVHVAAETWLYGLNDGDTYRYRSGGDEETARNLATTPLMGLIVGVVAALWSIAQLVGGVVAVIFLALPALCDLGNTRHHFKTAACTALAGGLMSVAYPCMLVYAHTFGWIEGAIDCCWWCVHRGL